MKSTRWVLVLYTLFMLGPWLFAVIGMAWTTMAEIADPEYLCELAGDPPHMPESVYWYFFRGVIPLLLVWLLIAATISIILWRVGWLSLRAILGTQLALGLHPGPLFLSGDGLSREFYRAVPEHCLANEIVPDGAPPIQD